MTEFGTETNEIEMETLRGTEIWTSIENEEIEKAVADGQ